MPAGPPARRRGLPLALWVGLAVVGAHLLFFLLVWDKHFLPKVPPPPPPPLAINFGARQTRTVDPRTGATVTEQDFTVSTQLASPPPTPTTSRSP